MHLQYVSLLLRITRWGLFLHEQILSTSCHRSYCITPFSMNLILQMHDGQRSMCGVIVVYVGRSRSTCRGRDAYIHDHCLGYRHDYLFFYQLPNSNLSTHHLLFFSREATSETYGPLVSFSYYLPLRSTFPLILFSDLLNLKYKNTLLQFICSAIYLSYLPLLPHVICLS